MDQVECPICFCSFPINEMIKCTKDHIICKNCVESWIKTGVEQGAARESCPCDDGTGCKIRIDDIKLLLPENYMNKFNENYQSISNPMRNVENDMSKSIFKECPNCHVRVVKFEGTCNLMTCSRCQKKFCFVCGEAVSGYDHFDTGKCPKFMDDKKYNQ